MTRRTFTGLAAAGALVQAQTEERKIGYCIIGLGRISMQHFMPGVKISDRCRITGIVSGHRDKAEKMAAQYGVPEKSIYNYQNMEAMTDNQEIDAVYVALPNSMHAEYSIRAARAGKHVLCEKPMATTIADSQAMIDGCRQAGKKLMIAYRLHFEPTNLRAIRTIREGQLGRVQTIESANGFNIKPGEWRLDKKMAGGGSLMDVGIYSVNACRYLTGEEPVEVKANCSVSDQDGRFNEVEENISWTMRFPSGILASCLTTYGANLSAFYRVSGTKGMLHLEPAFPYQGLRFTAKIQGEPPIDEPTDDPEPNQFKREADHLADCIVNNKEPQANGEEGLKDMKLLIALYRSCGRA